LAISLTIALRLGLAAATVAALTACVAPEIAPQGPGAIADAGAPPDAPSVASRRLERFARVRLEGDLALLTPRQRQMLALLIQAASTMDEIFWGQAYGDREALLLALRDPAERELAAINYGPWDRFDSDRPFIAGIGRKPAGANFYPIDMSPAEFLGADLPDKTRPDTLIGRTPRGSLTTVPYVRAYRWQLARAARLLGRAAEYCDDPALKRFLTLRARALITGDYGPSDAFWMEMRNNAVDLIMGPIHRREDTLFGYKTAYTAWVLVRDRAWTHQLAGIEDMLPELQNRLPVAPLYRSETPVVPEDLAAYDVVFYAGLANAGPKAGAISVPVHDESRGWRSRKLYLRNVMAVQFDQLIAPVAGELIVTDQRHHVTFDAFFTNTVLKEMSHGLGVRTTVNTGMPVAAALQRHHTMMEEGKAQILVPLVIEWLRQAGQMKVADRNDYYVTYVADTLRKVRAGGHHAGAMSDVIRFNYLRGFDGVTRDPDTGTYRVHPDRVHAAAVALAAQLLVLQGNGDQAGVDLLMADMGRLSEKLRDDLERLSSAQVPVGLIFEQGNEVLGLP
jgi:hypothetical protein